MQTVRTDLLVIGAGLAGERVALSSAMSGREVVILSLVPPRRSHSCAAQGGMQAALGNCAMGLGDGPDVHFADTVKGSDWGCDQDVARLFVDTAPVMKTATKTSSPKPATLSNGVTINVPEFVGVGERVRVNPNTSEYLDRAKD